VTAIDTSTGSPTLSVPVALIVPELAVTLAMTLAVPIPTPVANPPLPTVATFPRDEVQLTVLVRFCVLPSL
jgi:hypothetical protein